MPAILSVVIYVRLSLDRLGDELGIERQLAECRAFCAERGWKVIAEYVDNDLSATTGVVRPGFESLLQAQADAIVCWHIDRLVRLSSDLERILALGVNVYGLHAGHLDLSTPAGRAVARTITAWAQYEGEQKGIRQRAAAIQRAEQGKPWWPTRPFGFELDGTHHAEEAPALRAAYETLLLGGSLTAIARDWEAAGFVTVRAGKPWRATSIRPVILNPRNAGIRTYRGEEVGPAAWEAIVPEQTFRTAVRLLGDPARRNGGGKGGKGRRENLLTGLGTCFNHAESTVRVQWRQAKGSGGRYRVYTCSQRQDVSLRADFCDRAVRSAVIGGLERPGSLAQARRERLEGDAVGVGLAEALAGLQRRMEEVLDDYADGLIPRDERNRMTGRLRPQIERARGDLDRHRGDAVLGGLMDADDIGRHWDEVLDVNARHAAARAMFDRIVLLPMGKGRTEVTLAHLQVWPAGAQEPLAWG